jgi:hypothetical protein
MLPHKIVTEQATPDEMSNEQTRAYEAITSTAHNWRRHWNGRGSRPLRLLKNTEVHTSSTMDLRGSERWGASQNSFKNRERFEQEPLYPCHGWDSPHEVVSCSELFGDNILDPVFDLRCSFVVRR